MPLSIRGANKETEMDNEKKVTRISAKMKITELNTRLAASELRCEEQLKEIVDLRSFVTILEDTNSEFVEEAEERNTDIESLKGRLLSVSLMLELVVHLKENDVRLEDIISSFKMAASSLSLNDKPEE